VYSIALKGYFAIGNHQNRLNAGRCLNVAVCSSIRKPILEYLFATNILKLIKLMPKFDLSIIIVSFNTRHLLADMFESLHAASSKLTIQIIVTDNASSDGSCEFILSNYPEVLLIENTKNVGFGRANNQALPYIEGNYVLLLNTDAFVSPDTLEKTIRYMDKKPRCGVLGVKLKGRNGELQPSCRFFPTPLNVFLNSTGLNQIFRNIQMIDDMQWDHASTRRCDWVPGCYYLVRREVIDQVGLFDSRYFLYYEEVDHCFAVKNAGWETHYYPHTTVVHIGGESAKTEGILTNSGKQLENMQIESELLYFRKNHGLMTAINSVILCILGDAICIFKSLFRGRPKLRAFCYLKHSVLVCRLFARTRLGTKPTR